MLRKFSFSLIFFFFYQLISAQVITIQPYLQDAEPNSISILWETDSNEESMVKYGLSVDSLNETTGISYSSEGGTIIHEVTLNNLERFTKYYYQVKTGFAYSEIKQFKTPPFASDHQKTRLIAMSDMQRDGSFPNKFNEMIEDGVIQYLSNEFGGDITDNLALVMIPGDLVVTGSSFSQWKDHFFNPSESLFGNIPVYPVLGNHEQNSIYYFKYFKLPQNGSPGFEEHWWYKDYANVRIIGLNSNGNFAGQDQLDWLEDNLNQVCASDSIDFVFAQLHHPHKSELWTPGESNFTGEVINLIENFSTDCGKPSIHFFGHTHGYSRGQSRDHKHLWINVATAGGAIDNWGEFPNFDYDEFCVSQDEYGFVVVEVDDTENPAMTIKRISRGNQDLILNNVLTDSFTIRTQTIDITTPLALSPITEEIAPECVTLVASEFVADGSLAHGQSHWQVSVDPNSFDNPVFESWKNYENWYYDINTQAEDDLTDEAITGLEENTNYYWRVRYRDRELNWSPWSTVAGFNTTVSLLPENQIKNNGAENEINEWNVETGIMESLEANVCNGIVPYSGDRYFSVGGICDHSEIGIAYQEVDVSMFSDSINQTNYQVQFGGYLSNFSGSDLPEMKLAFYDTNGLKNGESETLSTLNSNWTFVQNKQIIPIGTRTIRMQLKGTRNAGTDNDSYFDDLFLRLGYIQEDCQSINSSLNSVQLTKNLTLVPNPFNQQTIINLPTEFIDNDIQLFIVDNQGYKIKSSYQLGDGQIILERAQLPAGMYNLIIRQANGFMATAKMVVTD